MTNQSTTVVLGIPIPSTDPFFLAIIGVHVMFGLAAVTAGAIAMLSGKGRGRHSNWGTIYFWFLPLTENGFLVPTKVYAPSTPDLKGVHTRLGDYVESELEARVNTPKLVGDIVSHWHRLAGGKKTVVFATSRVSRGDLTRRAGLVRDAQRRR